MPITTLQPLQKPNYKLLLNYIIINGFIAGSLDALAAIFILSHGKAASIFKFIASGLYGKAAFAGGQNMVILGLALHYFIAFSFTIFYYIIYRYVSILHKNIFLSAVLYGIFIYVVMNVMVLSLSNVNIPPRHVIGVVKNIVILSVCVALPAAYFKPAYNSKCKKLSGLSNNLAF